MEFGLSEGTDASEAGGGPRRRMPVASRGGSGWAASHFGSWPSSPGCWCGAFRVPFRSHSRPPRFCWRRPLQCLLALAAAETCGCLAHRPACLSATPPVRLVARGHAGRFRRDDQPSGLAIDRTGVGLGGTVATPAVWILVRSRRSIRRRAWLRRTAAVSNDASAGRLPATVVGADSFARRGRRRRVAACRCRSTADAWP